MLKSLMMRAKSGYSEHYPKGGKLSVLHPKRRQESFINGLGLLLGEKPWNFLPAYCPTCELLEYLVLTFLQRIHNTIGDPVFQQDNAPVHTARIVTEWLEEYNIQADAHPPYSPDLNPIKHVWVVLKQRLHKKYPNIADTPGGPDKVKAQLTEVLPEI